MKNRITLIGCPKLDEGDYREKLTQILLATGIKRLTDARMEVPCCGGLERAAKAALLDSGKDLPWRVVTVSGDGRILRDQHRCRFPTACRIRHAVCFDRFDINP